MGKAYTPNIKSDKGKKSLKDVWVVSDCVVYDGAEVEKLIVEALILGGSGGTAAIERSVIEGAKSRDIAGFE